MELLEVLTLFVTVTVTCSYDHINRKDYKVVLTNGYEDGIVGVHLKNKKQQDRAMKQFVAGDIEAGEMGNGIELHDVNKYVQKTKDDMYQGQGFDEYISEHLVSLNRSLPDRRDDWCKQNILVDPNYLPSTSVIIIFHNEAWSTLLRTVYSVINRSPAHLLAEVILVDDASTLPRLGQELQDWVDTMDKVKLIRNEERRGLMVTRMKGVLESKSQVLTFLDSHIEATDGWLEPLLERIYLNPKAIACPVIEEVNHKTFQYKFVTRDLVGVFFWNLDFGWRQIQIPNWAPYTTPAMAGGLFSIRKDWFAQLGFYDEGMEIWGGEQLELSFKTWMCGGAIEIVPCSRVGHVFRTFSPYKWTTKVKLPEYNYKRVAEVWMDEYKQYYYDRLVNVGEFGDVEDRKALRDSLQCKSFEWYLKNQMPHFLENKIIGAGEIRNFHWNFCLDQQDTEHNTGLPVLVFDCHGEKGNQYWYYKQDKSISRDFLCVGKRRKGSKNENHIELVPCDGEDSWDYNPHTAALKHEQSGKCLKVTRHPLKLWLKECDSKDTEQKWFWTNYDEDGVFLNQEDDSNADDHSTPRTDL